jgi:UDP-N-acetyl-D-mannosaminuronic acid dehydrogenase
MGVAELRACIEEKSVRLGVIGLGYVGLPVACVFAEAGFSVLGVDIDRARIDKLAAGLSPIEGNEPGLAELLAQVMETGRLQVTTDYEELRSCDVVTISVETPVDADHKPCYRALESALQSLGPVMKQGALVIVESTLAPGTMRSLVKPFLESTAGKRVGEDFYLGHCPERVMPGRLLKNLRSVSRVCGGDTSETAHAMISLYRHVVNADLDPADCVTAELVKTAENAYRDINIAFANEVALVCEAVGGDVWKVRDLVNKSPGRNMLLPGAGVGGHCIPKDPWLLVYEAREQGVPVRLVPAARAVNEAMPLHVVDLLEEALSEAGTSLGDARILVMGYSYLENAEDTRNSPSVGLIEGLRERGAEVVIHDPYVAAYQGDVVEMAQMCDGVVLMVAHDAYRQLDMQRLKSRLRTPVLVDGRHVYNRLPGWSTRGVGQSPLAV